jgi:2-methylcitrate dehydratase
MDSMIESLADYSAGLRYQDLPPEAVHEFKRRLIDSIGCLVGGFDAEPSVIARRLARRSRGNPPARILGTQEPSSPELAAFANGTMLRYLDFNDAYFNKASGHPSDTFAAVLAMADAAGIGGRALIAATAAAYEGYCGLSDAVEREKGWDHSVQCVIGSAVGAAKVLGLKKEAMGSAISLAITPNMALEQTRTGELAMWKGAAGPNAARNGVFAALLAREGMTGPAQAIEGKFGLWQKVGRFDWQPFGGRGRPFRLTQTHVKYFPVVIHAQSPVTVALELHEAVDAKDIEAVAIDTYWVAERYVDRKNPLWHPATRETADHSLPYCVVAGLLDGEVTEASFSARRLRDSRIAALLERTTIREVPEYSRAFPQEWPCRIEVTLRGGRKQAAEARYFRGHAKRPLSDEEIVRKFRFLAEKPLGRTRADAVLKMAWNADKLKNVRDLLRLLKFGRRGR